MKASMLTTSLFAAFVSIVTIAAGEMIVPAGSPFSLTGKLNSPYISCQGGTAYLQLTIIAPDIGTPRRAPMNLSVVLDRSGSMEEEGKIENAKSALMSLIDQLREDDIFSLVIYDDVIEVLQSAAHVGDKSRLKALVERIAPRGSTNLGGGMVEGFHQVECNLGKDYINRVVLLSDGLANVGLTDPRDLDRIARRERAKGISITTMGVGLDYNENLMMGIAENGSGNYYFIESPRSIVSIMKKEFHLLASLCARDAQLELRLGRNVVLQDAIGYEWKSVDGRCIVPLGDIYSGDRRELTLEVRVPEGAGTLTVASGNLQYDALGVTSPVAPSFSASLEYTADLGVVEQHRDVETQAKADVAVSTRAVEKATQALDEGKTEEAAQDLHAAQQTLSASPAAGAMGAGGEAIRNQAQRLDDFQSMIKDSTGDVRHAKKAIQYENYKQQKGKN